MGSRVTRKNSPHIKVLLLPDEKAEIERLARATGLSASAYLRRVGMGTPVSGVADQEAVLELAKVNSDLGRLGGLLKMWLTNDEKLDIAGEGDVEARVLDALREIRHLQATMLRVAMQVRGEKI